MKTPTLHLAAFMKSPFAKAELHLSIIPTGDTLSYDFHAHQNCLFMFSSSKANVGFAHETSQRSGKFTPRPFLLYRTKMTSRLKYSNVLDFNSNHNKYRLVQNWNLSLILFNLHSELRTKWLNSISGNNRNYSMILSKNEHLRKLKQKKKKQ